jgi:hypothetical protein
MDLDDASESEEAFAVLGGISSGVLHRPCSERRICKDDLRRDGSRNGQRCGPCNEGTSGGAWPDIDRIVEDEFRGDRGTEGEGSAIEDVDAVENCTGEDIVGDGLPCGDLHT